ncbi:TIGR02281 family clan AA aspartic protease [Aminobacter sp. NyZ550]|uniref:Aspartic protease n=2 Tax=Aminobacter TaxID=31988 RepID=A0AAC8YPD1_AMIAI|nr:MULTISPECIES: TIGR02281 family clan AA aspartic protease [Aminobacter]AMS42037.1 Aspartic protease [Aminobacter aminovorans]MBA8906095.1 aspartyl protease family protein [Aminobacter ciceronei]MBA9019874.1 aspartyl protease family protein [Aminobacter ciceronei]MBB3706723.1 aspartyl protease family protein [Aminobacter aminovorans]MRX31625.1 TIGR02281 family clan AA aspartic protease [Aminobacter sp. MDW-2]
MSRLYWVVIAVLGGGLLLLLLNHSSGETLGLNNDSFGQLIYAGALLLVIGAGVLRHGTRFGDTVRGLAMWVVIVLVFVAGYQYRYELQDVASRVTAGLVPGSPMSALDGDGRATVTLDKLTNGHFGARMQVNGQTIDVMVDTGATTTVLTVADARRAGFDLESLSFTVPVSTANGIAHAARVTAASVQLGSIERRNLPMLVADQGLEQSLLGMNFIGSLSGFDVRGDRMILRD